MRILLIGEFSRLHNSLKEGLLKLGHDVVLMGNKDGFKDYPVDIYVNHSFQNKILHKFKVGIYKLTGIDLGGLEVYYKAKKELSKLEKFEVIQFINESTFQLLPKLEMKLIQFIKTKGDKLFFLSCSFDHQNINYIMNGGFKYSILTPYLEDNSLKDEFKFQLQFLNAEFKDLHDFIYENSNGIIASDLDYHFPLIGNDKYLGLIPNPININKIDYIPLQIDGKIKIFHGINSEATVKKGNVYFTEALMLIEQKYGDKVDIQITYDLPYDEYIKRYDNCHIFLDQIYAYDQGFNALEAMAKGKVVFTGAEKEWLEHYDLKEDTVAINTLPNAEYIAGKIEALILNPDTLLEISKNARRFIEEHHRFEDIAEHYLKIWNHN